MTVSTPYYHLVPKDFSANQEYRRNIQALGDVSKAEADGLRFMCANDILFWCNTFAYTLNPRLKTKALPFITYEFQDETILELQNAIENGYDVAIEKSRDMGASWMMCQVCDWNFLFVPYFSALMLSRKEEYVDKTGDQKTLFSKIDFLHKWMPDWLLPDITRTKLHFGNNSNGATIDGESTNSEAGRGDRRTCIVQDEFAAVENGRQVQAATGDTTDCRIFNSTPMGTANAFHDVVTSPDIKRITLHWTRHPEKAKGIYYDGGKARSPWYDKECKRRVHPVEIAQEQDIDYQGSAYIYFGNQQVKELAAETKQPTWIGEIRYDHDLAIYIDREPNSRGRLLLWESPDATDSWPNDRQYVIGCDISAGTGSSNSCASIFDTKLGKKVGEFVTPHMTPDEFAVAVIALCKWFKGGDQQGAFLIWEANGPGRQFGSKVKDLDYTNIYRRQTENRTSTRWTPVMGWPSTKDNKIDLLGQYREAVSKKEYYNPSPESINEMREYIFSPATGIVHAKAESNPDPSGARDNHGDRVIADALSWRGAKVRKQNNFSWAPSVEVVAPNSFAARRQHRENESIRQQQMREYGFTL